MNGTTAPKKGRQQNGGEKQLKVVRGSVRRGMAKRERRIQTRKQPTQKSHGQMEGRTTGTRQGRAGQEGIGGEVTKDSGN